MGALAWLMNLGFAATGADAPPPAPVETASPAGRRRRRLYVQIDGQDFPVESLEHAQALLDQAKLLARRVAPQKAEEKLTTHLVVSPYQRPKIDRPHIVTHSPELHEIVRKAREVITETYKAAYRDAEIRLRMEGEQRAQEDDDEDFMMLL
jgi:hypothetical protein